MEQIERDQEERERQRKKRGTREEKGTKKRERRIDAEIIPDKSNRLEK